MIRESLRIIIILALSAMVGFVLLILAYCLPYNRIRHNVARTSYSFNTEGIYPELAQGYYSSILDNVTDAVMLGTAAAEIDNPIVDSVNASFEGAVTQEGERGTVGAMMDYVNEVKVEYEIVPYPRYWHGYLVVLKPLLTFVTYADVRILNIAFQTGVIVWFCGLISVNKGQKYLIPCLAVLIVLNPVVLGLSFQNSACFYCAFVPMIFLFYSSKCGLKLIKDAFNEKMGDG